jgi:hypothetical protein
MASAPHPGADDEVDDLVLRKQAALLHEHHQHLGTNLRTLRDRAHLTNAPVDAAANGLMLGDHLLRFNYVSAHRTFCCGSVFAPFNAWGWQAVRTVYQDVQGFGTSGQGTSSLTCMIYQAMTKEGVSPAAKKHQRVRNLCTSPDL